MLHFSKLCYGFIVLQLAAVVNVQSGLETKKSLVDNVTISNTGKTQVIGEGGLRVEAPNNSVHSTKTKEHETLNTTKLPQSTADKVKILNDTNYNLTATQQQKATTLNVSDSQPTKPTRTRHDDVPLDKIKEKIEPAPNIPSIDANFEKKNKKADYIVPIVGVIFSVPLLAIIISVVYKYGADWWQHRNYRRMDFLIEGMYNN